MPNKLLAVAVLLFATTACAPQQNLQIEINTKTVFDPKNVQFINVKGTATVTGQAFIRQRNGGVVTCAGQEVLLIPQGPHSRERFQNIYGTTYASARSINYADNADPVYAQMVRRIACDAEGDFEFSEIADGDYFATTNIVCLAGSVSQGGPLMSPVKVRDGKSPRILIAQ